MSVSTSEQATSLVDRVEELLQHVDYRCAETSADRAAIFRLRYDAYLREGAIRPNSTGQFSDPVDDRDNCWIFGVYIGGKLASSIRLSVTLPGRVDIPALDAFSDVLLDDIMAGKKFIDPTRFVADREASRHYPELPYVTLRLAWLALEYFNADYMLAAVRAEHQAFYKRLWGSKPIGSPRPYPNLEKPITLMTLDYHQARERVIRRFPFFRSSQFERRILFERSRSQSATQRSAA
jgi:hypothetical protein